MVHPVSLSLKKGVPMDSTPNRSLTLTLNDGHKIPLLGFGVYQSPPGRTTYESVSLALKTGYRHIDTASFYRNEADVGRAVRDCGLPRDEIFVTTKLWNSDQGYDRALKAFEHSLAELGLDYIDLYLLHWPVERRRLDSWKALAEIQRDGRCRSIGVSNYTIRHLEELISASDVIPAVNQVEFSPFLYQQELLTFCREASIVLEAYAPLTKGVRLSDPVLSRIAARHKRTPAQILIRWCIEHDVVTLPKSNTPSRIEENARVFDFELGADDLMELDSLDEGFRTSWDPTNAL